MPNSAPLFNQLLKLLRQSIRYKDLRHLKALAWMVNALICTGQLNLPAWKPYVSSRAQQAQSFERRWRWGMSYLKIGLRWLRGVGHEGRQLLAPVPLLPQHPQPCFASHKAEHEHYDQIWFSRIRSLRFQT
ncbi:MAG: hypothetical protein AB4050_00155 [Synechococcus sp.]